MAHAGFLVAPLALCLTLAVGGPARVAPPEAAPTPAPAGPDTVLRVLDSFHDAASKADERAYFALMHDDFIFLGTDAKERWTKEQFRTYVKPFFGAGRGWTYVPRPSTRHVTVAPDGTYAWFDELLDNATYGLCRGSGVLTRDTKAPNPDAWTILQYNLHVPVPNDLLKSFAEQIRSYEARPDSK